ncbi:HAD-IIB family hydrolase [Macrococcus sp. DPC7161]|uniref:HAD-IIB family hydrolase n=1 Tax=Macrococcus sp. DPC7161 TaxID=2507060 RepID=UPI00100AA014|nr:HAD-IIB family hydrolase [Macrococcus sp. DPC7161]RXK18659.1 HAD-IIB family hydrolase [Macrococcus sp. DPC7161]
MKTYHFPSNIRTLVCSDFDETYFAHHLQNKEDVQDFEKTMPNLIKDYDILFGIVSASTKAMLQHALEIGHFTYMPHFMSCNSGTEIYYIKDNEWIKDTDYDQLYQQAGINKSVILDIEDTLKSKGIGLITQTPFINAPYSRNYYYKATSPQVDEQRFETIRTLANEHGFIVNISMCNPMIGDPEGHYDVDFLPKISGKDAVVKYLMDKFNIDHQNTFAFGDSGNDIRMLNHVKHGYLVANATADAKQKFDHVLPYEYVKGIQFALNKHLL